MSTEQAPAEAPPVGTRLRDQYELTRFLGAGGMGAVYEALAPNGDRVAVKVLLRGLVGQAVDRFKREANVTSTLDGPHVVTTLDAGVDPALGIPFMVMPLLVGMDVQELIERVGPVHPTAAVCIARQAALALESAHARGIVHRDIKPANIYLQHEPSGRVTARVLDFGVAKWVEEGQAGLTATGSMLGTPLYMAPEQAMSTKGADGRADVWSLAASLYHALAGRAAFENLESIAELYVAITTTDIPMLQELALWVDPGLATVIHGALIREVDARCPSARAFADALAPYTFGSDIITASMLGPMSDELLRVRPALAKRPRSWGEVAERLPQPTTKLALTAEALDPLVGQALLGRYSILRRIGRGGMGSVYEAACADGRRVAVKVIDPERAGKDEAVRRRFVREVRAISSIRNENVVRILDADTDPSQQMPFVVMELLRGNDLGALIARQGALRPDVAVRIFLQACRGLEAAHAQGLIHRDIKPANLFLHQQPSGEIVVKICDFGIAKHVSVDGNAPAATASLTRTGGVVGSPMYMSPEQAKGAKAIDLRTDIWSLGVSLYQALSGCEPWGGRETMGEVLVGILTEPVPHLQDRAPWIPAALAAVVHKALSRDIDGRHGSVAELGQALAPFAGPRWSVLPADQEPIPAAERSVRAPRAELEGVARAAAAATGATVLGTPTGVTGTGNLVHTVTPKPRRRSLATIVITVALAASAGVGSAMLVWKILRPSTTAPAAAEDEPQGGVSATSTTNGEPSLAAPAAASDHVATDPVEAAGTATASAAAGTATASAAASAAASATASAKPAATATAKSGAVAAPKAAAPTPAPSVKVRETW